MRDFIDIILLESMSRGEANMVFGRFGVQDAMKLGADDLKTAYKKLAMANHPDRGGEEMAMSLINRAYAVLKTPAATPSLYKAEPAASAHNNNQRSYYSNHAGEQAHRKEQEKKAAMRARWNV